MDMKLTSWYTVYIVAATFPVAHLWHYTSASRQNFTGGGNTHSKTLSMEPNTPCHVVAIPYPGRGHINPMMNLCKLLVLKTDSILITFLVTEEWLGFIGSDPKPDKIRFRAIPNVIPSELVRAADLIAFVEAVSTKMEAPFDCLLDQLEPSASFIIADTCLFWAVGVGNRRNIPVASFWPMSAIAFSVLHHFDLFVQNGHFPVNCLESGYECVDYIPGVSSIRLVDLPPSIKGTRRRNLNRVLEAFSCVPKAQYLLCPTIYELESPVIDALKQEFSFPIYTIGPAIHYFNLGNQSSESTSDHDFNYLRWLDCQPSMSVLYVSLGSYLSVSSAQIDEMVAGFRESGVRFLWVARDETGRLKEVCGEMGLVVPWCDQLTVLCHPAIAGFWTHCGWNSVQEGIFAGVPFLTFPIATDQFPNSKLIVEDWKTGRRAKEGLRVENLVTRDEIAGIVQKFMDLESNEGKEMWRKAKELQVICQSAISKDGSSETNINSFIRDISYSSLPRVCYISLLIATVTRLNLQCAAIQFQ